MSRLIGRLLIFAALLPATFVRHGDGRIAAADGAHDDAIMAMAIAWAARDAG
jgi:hypothetical protein